VIDAKACDLFTPERRPNQHDLASQSDDIVRPGPLHRSDDGDPYANESVAAIIQRYVGIARPDHWIKNIFLIPGFAAALAVLPGEWKAGAAPLLIALLAGLVSLCLSASANYTINEYLDAPYDRFHPVKNQRPGALGLLDGRIVWLQYTALVAVSLAIAATLNLPFLVTTVLLLVMGIAYNVPPLRTKDKAYLDTLSESINNPLRFLLGWFVVAPTALPPSSVLLAYWMGGAYLMGVKRYSEYRSIADAARAALYRRSFEHYTEQRLLLSSFFYALCSMFFLAVFLIKYRIEFLLLTPLIAALFTWYLAIGARHESAAQAPEKLYREFAFMIFAGLTFLIGVALFFVDLPFVRVLMEPHILRVGGGTP